MLTWKYGMCTPSSVVAIFYATTLLMFASGEVGATDDSPDVDAQARQQAANNVFRQLGAWLKTRDPSPPRRPVIKPDWHPLSSESQKRIDAVLLAWVSACRRNKLSTCKLRRWDYDPHSASGEHPYRYSEGELSFARPGKWDWREVKVQRFVPGGNGRRPHYELGGREELDRSRCDGRSIFEFDEARKLIVQSSIVERGYMQRLWLLQPIDLLPIPLVRTELTPMQLQERFWVRSLDPPKEHQGEYWLEFVPKREEDAAWLSSLVAVIAEGDMRVTGLDVRSPNYDPKKYKAHTEYEFLDWSAVRPMGSSFADHFGEPSMPLGWKRVMLEAPTKQNPKPKE